MLGSGYIQRAAPINSFPPVLPTPGQDVAHDITGAREEKKQAVYFCTRVDTELQPPLEKWRFLLDDDKPHYKKWWFANQPVKNAGWMLVGLSGKGSYWPNILFSLLCCFPIRASIIPPSPMRKS